MKNRALTAMFEPCFIPRHFCHGTYHSLLFRAGTKKSEKSEDLEYLAVINYEILEYMFWNKNQLPHQIFAKWVNETENG